MAFTNEYLTKEEIELIKQTGHDALVNRHHNNFCYVIQCTVDREKNIWLMHYPRRADYEWELKEERFVLFYGAIDKKNVVELCMINLGIEKDPLIKEKHDVNLITYWALKSIEISQYLNIDESMILNILEEIMSAYCIMGDPEEKEEEYYKKRKAIIKE